MAFGFFKKSEAADLIIKGGKIYTMDPDFPCAEAVACKGGTILAVGDTDAIEAFEDENTEVIDLEAGYMLPGLIDTYGHPVFKSFENTCLFLTEATNLESIITQIKGYVSKNQDKESYFIFGYDEKILKDIETENTRKLLDEVSSDKPIVVLGESGIHCWINTIAFDLVSEAAREEEQTAITLPYLLSVLAPIDFEAVQEKVIDIALEYCQRGVTTVFDCGSPDFLDSVYEEVLVNMYSENMLKQRYYGSLLINRDVSVPSVISKLKQKRTNCAELNGFINYNALKLVVNRKTAGSSISPEGLADLIKNTADNGFDIHIDATGKTAVFESLEALKASRAAGYKKNRFVIAHEEVFSAEEKEDYPFDEDIDEISPTLDMSDTFAAIAAANTAEEATEILTFDAAMALGILDKAGTIEKGKRADFVIYDRNPLEAYNVEEFKRMKAVMTIMGGQVVYDSEDENLDEWYEIISSQAY